jgi:hypothetical protein
MKKILTFFILSLTVMYSMASEKYCSKEGVGKSYDLHLFTYTFSDESQKKLMLRSLNELKNKFQMGDRVRVFKHNTNSYNIAIDQCVPGCPEKGFFEGFLDATCSVQVANKDKIVFQQTFAKLVLEDIKKDTKDYDIFRSVQTLADFYRSSTRKAEVYAALSMVPYGIDPRDKGKLDSKFVVAITQLQLPSSDFPPVTTIGAAPDKELMDFWKEIFKYKKVKFNLEAF